MFFGRIEDTIISFWKFLTFRKFKILQMNLKPLFFTSDWSILLKNATSLRIYLSHNVLLCIDKVMPHWGGSFFKTFFWWYYRVQLWKESLCIFPVGGRSQTTLTSFWLFWPPTPNCATSLTVFTLEKLTFLDYLPTSSCKRSPRSSSIWCY